MKEIEKLIEAAREAEVILDEYIGDTDPLGYDEDEELPDDTKTFQKLVEAIAAAESVLKRSKTFECIPFEDEDYVTQDWLDTQASMLQDVHIEVGQRIQIIVIPEDK